VIADAQRTIAIETYSASKLLVRNRLAYWNELAAATYTPVVVTPMDLLTFAPELERVRIGEAHIGRLALSASQLSHTREHAMRTVAPLFFLQLQLEGASSHEQDGREAHLQPGDFTLLDNTRPYHSRFDLGNVMLIVGLPEGVMRRHLGCPENLVCVPMPGTSGANALVSQFLRSLWMQCRSGLEAASATRLSEALLHLISGSYATLPCTRSPPTASRLAARQRAISFIERHLGEAALSPTNVAAACGMTPRHLHRLFCDQDQTVGCYILRRRLQESARLLASPHHGGRTITAIAVDHGFNSIKSFSRTFRKYYSVTPTQFRAQFAS
jgi:AraC-like DNA-binding protein